MVSQLWMLQSPPYVRHGFLSVDFLTFTLVMAYLWHSKTGVDNLDNTLNHIITVTWGSAAVPSAFQIIAVSMYNSDSVRYFRCKKWR
jgi:hypothetical protein